MDDGDDEEINGQGNTNASVSSRNKPESSDITLSFSHDTGDKLENSERLKLNHDPIVITQTKPTKEVRLQYQDKPYSSHIEDLNFSSIESSIDDKR